MRICFSDGNLLCVCSFYMSRFRPVNVPDKSDDKTGILYYASFKDRECKLCAFSCTKWGNKCYFLNMFLNTSSAIWLDKQSGLTPLVEQSSAVTF